MKMFQTATLLPGLGPLFFGILIGSAGVWACCRAILCAQLAGSRPLVRPGPVTGRPGPAMTASSQPALFAQPSCKQGAKETHESRGANSSRCVTMLKKLPIGQSVCPGEIKLFAQIGLFLAKGQRKQSSTPLNRVTPTLLPGLGPRFLGTLGSSPLPAWMLCGPSTELFWLQGLDTLVFLRPGLRPL